MPEDVLGLQFRDTPGGFVMTVSGQATLRKLREELRRRDKTLAVLAAALAITGARRIGLDQPIEGDDARQPGAPDPDLS